MIEMRRMRIKREKEMTDLRKSIDREEAGW